MNTRIDSLKATWSELDFNKKALTLLATGTLLTAVSVSAWHLSQPEYTIFMQGVEQRDMREVVATLDANKVNYKIGGSSILVDSRHQDIASAALARDGLPNNSHDGYAHLSNNSNVYTSQVKENLFKNQILEEELSKLINVIDGVQDSKVKLALSKESQFLRDSQAASASVVLTLQNGAVMSKKQVYGIINIVSSGIPNLPPEGVVVLDQTGRMLSQLGEDYFGGSHIELRQTYERELRNKIVEIVAPLVGLDSLRVNVTSAFNFDKVENTTEEPLERSVILSEQTETTYDQSLSGGSGVPGALSNQPPEHADFSDTPAAPNNAPDNSAIGHERAVRNYNVGRSITHTKSATGRLESTSVAILFDQGDFEEEDILLLEGRIEAIIHASMGFNEENDQVLVQGIPFIESNVESDVTSEPAVWESEIVKELITTSKWIFGGILFYLFFFLKLLNRIAPINERKDDELSDDMLAASELSAEDIENNDLFDFPSEDESNRTAEEYNRLTNEAYKLIDGESAIALEIVKGMLAGREFAPSNNSDDHNDDNPNANLSEEEIAAMMGFDATDEENK
ncbi:Flagellar M-ring protein [Vibrio chagasii]|nr:Flagellar M-ring protein [Vibrio chagasii]